MEHVVNGLRLIGDIGGTNARFAIAQGGKYRQVKQVENEHYPSLYDAMADYLGRCRNPSAKTSTARSPSPAPSLATAYR